MFENEIWEDLIGYESIYIISNLGRVKILPRININKSGIIISKEKFVKLHKSKQGYVSLSLNKNGAKRTQYLHRLLANTFIPNTENKPQVNHKNGIKNDNRLENLEWTTSKENIIHARDKGLRLAPRGDSHSSSKLTEVEVLDIKKRLRNKEKQINISKLYNVSTSNITLIKIGKIWSHI